MNFSAFGRKSGADLLTGFDLRLYRDMVLHDDHNGIYGGDGIHVRSHALRLWQLLRY